ncbi:Lam1p [Saccharomyces eubayanus]|uniref:Lam1p n=1 Tax=Saccharomyces eubayanus TaxID=1080349 RepID=UPI0006C20FCD|nr:YSP1-like protein [Saccharomyces eubayanus]KOG99215.1 YSP1-like protein [Saccharomyces eubayanus]
MMHEPKAELRLITVAFNEASTDSPSFRASVNYFHTKMESLNGWLQNAVDYVENTYRPSFEDFQRIKETLFSQLLPSPILLSNGFVSNQAYTPLLVRDFAKDINDLSNTVLKIILGDENSQYTTALTALSSDAIDPYLSSRKNFEYYQRKHDSFMNDFLASSNDGDSLTPQNLQNETLKLFDIKHKYVEASLDLVEAISLMKVNLDKFLVETIDIIRKNNMITTKDTKDVTDITPELTETLKEWSDWIENNLQTFQALSSKSSEAKRAILKLTLARLKPSRLLQDYDLNVIQNLKFNSPKSASGKVIHEQKGISGWLYMRTTVGHNPKRVVWVRRWCFLHNSIFGVFSLSPNKTYVEETDKFGILWISVEYLPKESRNFCFKLKIQNPNNKTGEENTHIDIILQAESVGELKAWIGMFNFHKQYALSIKDTNNPRYQLAIKKIEPQFFEFASSTSTSTDKLLTSLSGSTLTLVEELKKNYLSENDIDSIIDNRAYHLKVISTPIFTQLTQLALFSTYLSVSSYYPGATQANVWGAANWNDFSYLYNPIGDKSVHEPPKVSSASRFSVTYPEYYPYNMKIDDIQFRSIFFSVNYDFLEVPKELVLLRYSSVWYPNNKQKFSSMAFVTLNNIYVYLNISGFSYLRKIDLLDIDSIEYDRGPKHASSRMLHMQKSDGVKFNMSIFFTDRRAVASKLQFLVENKAMHGPKGEKEVLEVFQRLDEEIKNERNVIKNNLSEVELYSKEHLLKNTYDLHFENTEETPVELMSRKVRLEGEAQFYFQDNYRVGSKTLFHVLFGDKSQVFPSSLFLCKKGSNMNNSTYWECIKHTEQDDNCQFELVRKLQFQLNRTSNYIKEQFCLKNDNDNYKISLAQRIVKIKQNYYYEVNEGPFIVKFPLCHPLVVSVKFIIAECITSQGESLKKCDLAILYNFKFIESVDQMDTKVKKLWLLENIHLGWVLRFCKIEHFAINKKVREYLKKFNDRERMSDVIKLCGFLGVLPTKSSQSKKKTDYNMQPVQINYDFLLLLKIITKLAVFYLSGFIIRTTRILIAIIMLICRCFAKFNKSLYYGLLMSALINLVFVGKSIHSYFSVKRAETLFQNYANGGQAELQIMHRSLTVPDLNVLTEKMIDDDDQAGVVFRRFGEEENSYQYKETRQEIAIKRNQVLVDLRILQSTENELVQGSYRKFLITERDKCLTTKTEMPELWMNDPKLQGYCNECFAEYERLSTIPV